jgi:hypothetical protein
VALLPSSGQDKTAAITPKEAAGFLSQGYWQDDPALRLVCSDAEQAEQFVQSKQFILGHGHADILYQSPITPRYWPGTQTEAASVQFHIVSTTVNAIVDQIMAGVFFDPVPFIIQERSNTTAQQARAVSALQAYQLEDIDFAEEIRLGTTNAALYGTEIFQWGWEKFTRERKIIERDAPPKIVKSPVPGLPDTKIPTGQLVAKIEEEVVDRPTFEHIVNLREILVDPGLNVPDIRKAKYVIRRRYMTFQDLDKLRDREGYDIPPEKELLDLFFPPSESPEEAPAELNARNPLYDIKGEPRWEDTTSDPTQKPLEVLERWDNNTYIVVLQKKIVIYNDRNIYGKIPFLSVNWEDVPGAFWGLGLARLTGTWQRLMEGVTNLLLDQAALNLNGVYVRVKGKSIPTQNIRIQPGKIIDVDDPKGFTPLDRLPAIPEAGQILAMAQGRVDAIAGANPIGGMGQAGASGHSNLARSSAGAQGLMQGSATSISGFVDRLSRQVIVPFLYEVYEMNREFLAEDQIAHILDDELMLAYDSEDDSDPLADIFNAHPKFSVLAGAKMQTRRNMAQGLPLLTQFLANPAITGQLAIEGKKVDVNEIVRMWFEASDWRNLKDVVVPMTDEDKTRQQQQSQGGVIQQKAQSQAQLQQQKDQAAQQKADNDNIARAARDVLRESFKKSVEPDVLTGQPNESGTGFGGNAI